VFALKLIAVICLIGTVIPAVRLAHAFAIPTWRFDDETIFAHPTERILVYGTLTNDASAQHDFVIGSLNPSGGEGAPPGGGSPLTHGYEVKLATALFVAPVWVPPGESYGFLWATLTPRPGLSPGMIFGPGTASFNGIESENLFVIQIVPDPCVDLGGDSDRDTLCDDEDPCKFFPNTLPLVISDIFHGIPDECLCGDFDGDGFVTATDAAAINECSAYLRFDCDPRRDDVKGDFDGWFSATDADLVNRVATFFDPAYLLTCSRRPELTCGGMTGVRCGMFTQGCTMDFECNIPGGHTEYCKKSVGDCLGRGLCTKVLGDACPLVSDPVCGCDGHTYGNQCEATIRGVNVDHRGICD
jgi:hypothetical protein